MRDSRGVEDMEDVTTADLLAHSRVATTEMYLHCSQKQLEQAMLADRWGRVYS